ncbi:alkaline-phosphatase-like protein [Xylariaceae sp. FL0804]|nr:alkaline-phosphatase-like protein [Xylariaceae sp. FL0804]
MAADTGKKNVLLMVADDLGLFLGCYGLKSIKTPEIDRLAAEGTRFTHGFASTASCSGSRSTIYTGLHTHENGQYGLAYGKNHFQTHDHIDTLPRLFNAAGYQTGLVGKVHVGPRPVYPWETFEESQSRDVGWNAERAGVFMDKALETKRPFHLTVAFRDPHRDDTRDGWGNQDDEVKPYPVPDYQPSDVEIPEFLMDVPEVRKELVEYYKSSSRLDLGVGKVLHELKSRGLDRNTMVVFISDNGAPFVNSKTTCYDAGVRLPFIVRVPGGRAGVINPNLVSFLDLVPTFLDWCGIDDTSATAAAAAAAAAPLPGAPKPSPRREGRSVVPILGAGDVLGPDEWRTHVFGSHTFHEVQNYYPTRFLRTRRHKYHRNIAWRLDFPFATDLYGSLSFEGVRNMPTGGEPVRFGRRPAVDYFRRGPEQLFDMEADPEEVRDLASDPGHADVLKGMRDELERWQYRTDDPWLMRDGVSLFTSRNHQKEGLKIPDRFDFDPHHPQSHDLPSWEAPWAVGREGPRAH